MSAQDIQYPNYESVEDSPELDGLGVAIRLAPPEGGEYRAGEPVILNGAYNCTLAQERASGGEPLAETVIVLQRADESEIWRRSVQREGLPTEPGDAGGIDDNETLIGGYFNLDLHEFMPELDEPGHYRVWAELLDLKSDVLDLEIGV